MQLQIPLRALSVNDSLKGRKIKSEEYLRFEKEVCYFLPFNKGDVLEGELFIQYVFYFKNYLGSDNDNGIKALQDILVKRGYMKDDRHIKETLARKERVKDIKDEKVEITLVRYEDRMSVICPIETKL